MEKPEAEVRHHHHQAINKAEAAAYCVSRPVLIAGATGQNADSVNGIYEPTGEIYNDRTLFRKKGDSTKWLRYVSSNGLWLVSSDSDKEANNSNGWSSSRPGGLKDPADASSWQIFDGSTFKEQSAVKAAYST